MGEGDAQRLHDGEQEGAGDELKPQLSTDQA